jgi:hypothetical protein
VGFVRVGAILFEKPLCVLTAGQDWTVSGQQCAMTITRRNFLQGMGRWGAGLGLANLALVGRYQAALAQPTARKLALLIGIDQYPKLSHTPFLKGSVTDVELQRELLTSRFGFSRQDVLTLVDEDATRANIEAAFTAHLSDQARPGDVVVFHFSGYGCLIRTQTQAENGEKPYYGDQQALVTYDAELPDLGVGKTSALNGIYEDTLFLLLRSLLTDQVTTLLDCGFIPTGVLRSKSLRERALSPWDVKAYLVAELAVQDRLLAQIQLTRDQVQVQRQSGQLPGLVLAAATAKHPTALEQDHDGFSAGVFSSGLIQQLWANTPATNITIQVGQLSAQVAVHIGPGTQPTVKGQKSGGMLPWSNGLFSMPAVGIISLIDRRGKTGKLWLGGLPETLLEQYQGQSCFHAINPFPEGAKTSLQPTNLVLLPIIPPPTLVQIRSRQGWTAIAQHLSGPLLQEGWFLEEATRVLPRKISLRLALGSDLSRIERVDATSVVSMKKSGLRIVSGEQPADYIFTTLQLPPSDLVESSRLPPLTLSLSPQPPTRYGLAYLGGAMLSNTVGAQGEVIKRGIERLQSTLDVLLAIKQLELSVNHGAAALRLSASLEQVEETPELLIRLQSMRMGFPQATEETPEPTLPRADKTSNMLSIPSGTPIQYRITNGDVVPIYVLLVGFNGGTLTFASYTLDGSPPAERKPLLKPLVVQPGSSVILPTASQTWKASGFTDLNKTFIVCTRQPLGQTLAVQANGMRSMLPSISSGFAPLLNPLAIAQALFADLHQASLPTTSALGITGKNVWALDVQEWTTLQFIYATV